MIFHILLQRTDGSFYFTFHIKCDYFLVPKAACRSSVSSLIFYVGKTQQDLLSVGWHLNKRRRANILTSCSRGNFLPSDPHPSHPLPFSLPKILFQKRKGKGRREEKRREENDFTRFKTLLDYWFWAWCQCVDPSVLLFPEPCPSLGPLIAHPV